VFVMAMPVALLAVLCAFKLKSVSDVKPAETAAA
jgi:hypothetical protein